MNLIIGSEIFIEEDPRGIGLSSVYQRRCCPLLACACWCVRMSVDKKKQWKHIYTLQESLATLQTPRSIKIPTNPVISLTLANNQPSHTQQSSLPVFSYLFRNMLDLISLVTCFSLTKKKIGLNRFVNTSIIQCVLHEFNHAPLLPRHLNWPAVAMVYRSVLALTRRP